MYRGGGSVAIVGACRAAFAVAPNPEDSSEGVFVPIKYNLGPKPPSLTYTIEAAGNSSRIVWGDTIDLSAADVLKAKRGAGGNTKLDRAKEILEETLAWGPRPEKEILNACEHENISRRTYFQARKEMGIHSEKEKGKFGGQWILSMLSNNGDGTHEF